MAENRVIGRDNSLPWRLPNDMRHFMKTTMGRPVIMGRKTFESMKAPLPGRTNIVLTQNEQWQREGVQIVPTLEEAIALAESQSLIDGVDEVMVIGGATLYREAIEQVDRMYVTQVHASPDGDAFFEAPDQDKFTRISVDDHAGDDVSPAHSYEVWERI